jgi:hypothetical protein
MAHAVRVSLFYYLITQLQLLLLEFQYCKCDALILIFQSYLEKQQTRANKHSGLAKAVKENERGALLVLIN